jgi:D-methionine transport system substrate-binding protein
VDAIENDEFVKNLAKHTVIPYSKWWLEQDPHAFLGSDAEAEGQPIGFYSTKYKTRAEIPDKAVIAVPNNATNEYRALRILEQNGFIKLKPDIENFSATKEDIAEYVKPVEIVELDAGIIIRNGDQFDGYITNTNRILEAGIDPTSALFREGKDSPYANILVTKTARVNDPAIVALKNALTTEEVRKFIEEKYNGAVVPAF